MAKNRLETLLAIVRGLMVAVAVTLACMAVVAALAVYMGISDIMLRGLNQAMKLLAMIAGTCAAVARGGHRGFVTGMALSMLYMILGYGMYMSLGSGSFDAAGMLGEILIGAAVGGICGAVRANLPAKRRRVTRAAQ